MRLESLVNKNYDLLTANDREMVNRIFRDKESVRGMNSTQLAAYLNVSRTTFVRFMKKMGIDTFAEFRLLLAEEERKPEGSVFNMADIVDNYHGMIDELKRHDYSKVCRMIADAGTIYLYGSGNEQKAIAEEFKRIFLIFGKYCVDLFDFGETEFARERFRKNDLFIAISLSGSHTCSAVCTGGRDPDAVTDALGEQYTGSHVPGESVRGDKDRLSGSQPVL